MTKRWLWSSLMPKTIAAVMVLSAIAAPAAANYDSCGATSGGSSTWCNNFMSFNDNLANASNRMNDYFNAPDPYHIHFTMTSWYPSVTRGAPIYTNYWIVDNFNSRQVYLNSDYNGRYLNDYYNITIGTNVTAGYYPQPYGKPTTAMQIRNADPGSCISRPWDCISYAQSSEFFVN